MMLPSYIGLILSQDPRIQSLTHQDFVEYQKGLFHVAHLFFSIKLQVTREYVIYI